MASLFSCHSRKFLLTGKVVTWDLLFFFKARAEIKFRCRLCFMLPRISDFHQFCCALTSQAPTSDRFLRLNLIVSAAIFRKLRNKFLQFQQFRLFGAIFLYPSFTNECYRAVACFATWAIQVQFQFSPNVPSDVGDGKSIGWNQLDEMEVKCF